MKKEPTQADLDSITLWRGSRDAYNARQKGIILTYASDTYFLATGFVICNKKKEIAEDIVMREIKTKIYDKGHHGLVDCDIRVDYISVGAYNAFLTYSVQGTPVFRQ